MKNNFADYYRPEKDDLDKAYDNAVFILDTNTLLDLYRINPSVSKKALKTIEKYKNRIFITRHTDLEYHRHHYEITAQMCMTVKEVVTHLTPDPFKTKLEEIVNKNSKFGCQFPSDLLKVFSTRLNDTINDIRKELSELQRHYNGNFETHHLQHQISELFKDRVLPGLTDDRINQIIKEEGPRRFKAKTPPGYMDAVKATAENDNNAFGDLIIWIEILNYVEKHPNDVFFICRDEKEDWISKVGEKKIGPRWELLVEFRKSAPGKIFHIINLTEFLERFGKEENFSEDELGSIPRGSFDPLPYTDSRWDKEYKSLAKTHRMITLPSGYQVEEAREGHSISKSFKARTRENPGVQPSPSDDLE